MPTSTATCTVQYVHFSFYVRAGASRNLSSLQPLKVFECVYVHACHRPCLRCPPSCLLISRCSGGKAALRSEQTRHHGCGWGGEYEWVDSVFSPFSVYLPVWAKPGLLNVCLYFFSLFSARMSSLICPPVSLWCVISVNAFYLYYTRINVLCLHFIK